MTNYPETLVVMGVCGVGKTSIAQGLADRLPAIKVEADDFHPEENIAAMRQGDPLTDEMRIPWLRGISEVLVNLREQSQSAHIVVACSALKRSYRDIIREHVPDVKIVFLTGPENLIRERMTARTDHFMPTRLLDSQLKTLEPPEADENHLEVSIVGTENEVVSRILRQLMPETTPNRTY